VARQREQEGRDAFEEEREDDREPVSGFHEAEERLVLADQERRKRSDGDSDSGQSGECEDRIFHAPPEQPHRCEQNEAGGPGAHDVEQKQGPDRGDDREVRVVVLLGVNRRDEEQGHGPEVPSELARDLDGTVR
jgi:hypothetical protein